MNMSYIWKRKHLSARGKKASSAALVSIDWVLTPATAFAAVSGSSATLSFNLTF